VEGTERLGQQTLPGVDRRARDLDAESGELLELPVDRQMEQVFIDDDGRQELVAGQNIPD